ncbi:hypothetical protein P5E48_04055 [Clostridium perfringens]|uniref:Uncharacterized protein n=1 Tax=Clostridium perfringens TaxID=1502 RepID=A0A8H9QV46_CLOPF|nr:hypothetical protein [Clostridium perfringens]MDK0537283.1 hypothetical protein [Clostridium perfringens]MDK0564488.1 hypothetical protein [Clostridium perfringens]MDK0617348.1 hypothetical protein [Clostridium perfringens]MDK0792412.1 hypothetical protein [Clostridium perfringens]MDK0979547.1 hypothetical protein [Clostridium perfringens]
MNKFMLRRLILGVSLFFIIIFSSAFIINKIYIKQKCKDLYFATEYLTTRGDLENSLLTIKNFELSFLDKDIAIVEINGISYDKPHQSISCKAYFEKKENSVWDLKEIEKLT